MRYSWISPLSIPPKPIDHVWVRLPQHRDCGLLLPPGAAAVAVSAGNATQHNRGPQRVTGALEAVRGTDSGSELRGCWEPRRAAAGAAPDSRKALGRDQGTELCPRATRRG